MISRKPAPYRHAPRITAFGVFATLLALLIILGVVGQADYEDQRAEECHREGKIYNHAKDTCE